MPVEQESREKFKLRTHLCDQVVAIRQRRRLVEEKWLRSRRNWMAFNTGNYTPSDTAPGTYNVPAGRRVLERAIVRSVKLLTPSVKWFEVAPMGNNVNQEALTNVDAYLWYVLRKKIQSRVIISQLVRCLILYGRAILKTSVAMRNGEVWPTWRAVDPFAFHTFPETAPTLNEAEIKFEDILFSYDTYKTFSDMGMVDDISIDDLTAPSWPYHLIERLAYQGITNPGQDIQRAVYNVNSELKGTAINYVSCSEVWLNKEDKLYQAYILWNHKAGPRIVGFFQSQYTDPLYRVAIHRALPGETYTNSQAEDINQLDNIQNDLWNQFIAATQFEQGFIIRNYAETSKRKDGHVMKGRAIWDADGDPRELFNFVSPPNTSTNMLRAYQVASGIMNSIGGNGTLSEGVPGRNMPRAGFAAQSLIDLGMADVQDISELIEQAILTPGIGDIYKVTNFIPDSQLMRIPNGQALYHLTRSNVISKSAMLGDYEFEWVGALQFQDGQQRAQQLLMFTNLLMQPQTQQALASQQLTVNWAELIPMVWRYGLGERGLDKILIPIPQQPIVPEVPMNGGVPTTNGQNGRANPPSLQPTIPALPNGNVRV